MRDRGDADGHLSADEFCQYWLDYFFNLSDRQFNERTDEWEYHLAASQRKLLLRRVFARMVCATYALPCRARLTASVQLGRPTCPSTARSE